VVGVLSQAEVQKYLEKHGEATVEELADQINVSDRTLYQNLKRLRRWGKATVKNASTRKIGEPMIWEPTK